MNAQNVYPMPTGPGPDEIRTEVVEVTPRTAAEWLTLNRRNRRARTLLVSKYAADMAAGQWRMAGEPIKFDTSGNLLDGQHRLSAVMLSGATVTMLVVRGLPPESQAVMDSGSARTAMVMDDWLELVLTVGKHRRTTLRDLTRNDLARIISERQQNYDRAGASLSEVKSVAAMLDAALSDYETIPAALDAGALSMHFDADAPTHVEAAS